MTSVCLLRLPSSALWGGRVLSLFDSYFVLSGHSYPLHERHCLTCMWLGYPAKFRLRDSPCQLYCIGSMDAEEDGQDLRLLDSTIYPLQSVMFLLHSKDPSILPLLWLVHGLASRYFVLIRWMPSSRLAWHIIGYTFSIHSHSSLASVG